MPSSCLFQAQSIIKESQLLRQDDNIDIYINVVFTTHRPEVSTGGSINQEKKQNVDGGELLAVFDICEMHTVYNKNEIDREFEESVNHQEFVFDCSHITINEDGFCNNSILEYEIIYNALQEIRLFLTGKYAKDINVKSHFNIYASESIRDTAWTFAYLLNNDFPLKQAKWEVDEDLLSLVSDDNSFLKDYKENWSLLIEYISIATPITLFFYKEQGNPLEEILDDLFNDYKVGLIKKVSNSNVVQQEQKKDNKGKSLGDVANKKQDNNTDLIDGQGTLTLKSSISYDRYIPADDKYIPTDEEIQMNHPYFDRIARWFYTSQNTYNAENLGGNIREYISGIGNTLENIRIGQGRRAQEFLERNRIIFENIRRDAKDNVDKVVNNLDRLWNSPICKGTRLSRKDLFLRTHLIPGVGFIILSVERAYYISRASLALMNDNDDDFEHYIGEAFKGPLMTSLGYDVALKNYCMCLCNSLKAHALEIEYGRLDPSSDEADRILSNIERYDKKAECNWHEANGSFGKATHKTLEILSWIPFYGVGPIASAVDTIFYGIQYVLEEDEKKKQEYLERFGWGAFFGALPYAKKASMVIRKEKAIFEKSKSLNQYIKSQDQLLGDDYENYCRAVMNKESVEKLLNNWKGNSKTKTKLLDIWERSTVNARNYEAYLRIDAEELRQMRITAGKVSREGNHTFFNYLFQRGDFGDKPLNYLKEKLLQEVTRNQLDLSAN